MTNVTRINRIRTILRKYRNRSHQLSIDFENVESNMYLKITKDTIIKFSLNPLNQLTVGLDEKFQCFTYKGKEIGLEWDIYLLQKINKLKDLQTKLQRTYRQLYKGLFYV